MKKIITTPFVFLALSFGISNSANASIALFEYGFNIDGIVSVNSVPAQVDVTAFDDATGIGDISISITGNGSHSFGAFFDHEIIDNNNPNDNESGSANGFPSAGQSWEIDEPGYVDGDIYFNFWDALLDNGIGTYDYGGGDTGTTSFPDDVSMAMGWDFTLADGETATIMLMLGITDPGGFFLKQTDEDSSDAIYFSSTLEITSALSPVPVPAAIWLFASGLLGLVGAKRRMGSKNK